MISFSIFWILLGLILIGFNIIKTLGIKLNISNKVVIIFRMCFILIMISFIVIESCIIYFGSSRDMKQSDYLIILGAGVRGTRLSLTLTQRMQESLNYLKKYPNTKVIVSGGQGPGESITEAEAMSRFLINHGVDKKQIIKEERSTSTYENFLFSKMVIERIDKRNDFEVSIITSDFHMFRAKLLAERAGFERINLVPAKLHILLVPNYYVREYLAVIKSIVFDK